MSKRYGLPIMGSKNKLAEKIVAILPKARHLYDIMCGGGAVSHAALLSGKWECVHFSDITDSVVLFKDALEGNIPDGSEWISREEFHARKATDPYVRLVWSFASNGRDYIYGPKIEPYKKAVHELIYAPTPQERRVKFREVLRLLPTVLENYSSKDEGELPRAAFELQHDDNKITPPHNLLSIKNLFNLQSTQNHNRLEYCKLPPPRESNIRSGDNRSTSERREEAVDFRPFLFRGEYEMRVCDYREVDILPDSVVYADIPYFNTGGYDAKSNKCTFDHNTFYDWCESLEVPVFISEYWMPEDRFKVIAQWDRLSTFSGRNNSLKVEEKLFVPNKWYESFRQDKIKQLSLF